jgi:hypothetical protein
MAIDDRMLSLLPVVNQPWPPPQYDPINYQFRLFGSGMRGIRGTFKNCRGL